MLAKQIMNRPQPTLHDSLQEEFCPPLDTSLLAALLADLPPDPSPDTIASLRATLTELAAQADADEHRLAQSLDALDLDLASTTDQDGTADFFSRPTGTGTASSTSGSSQASLGSPLGFLQAALPGVPTSTLKRAIADTCGGDDWDADSEFDMEAVVNTLLTQEYIRELEERGLDDEDDGEDDPGSWEAVAVRKSKSAPKAKPKAGKRSTHPKGRASTTIKLSDVRQWHHAPPRSHSANAHASAPDPWMHLTSLSTNLASLLPPHPPSFFASYFHDPANACPADALRAALAALAPSPSSPVLATSTSEADGIVEVLLCSHPLAPPTRLTADAHLACDAAPDAASALDIVHLLHDLEEDSGAGVWHSPVSKSPARFSNANADISSPVPGSSLPTAPPPILPSPSSAAKSYGALPQKRNKPSPYQWQRVYTNPAPSSSPSSFSASPFTKKRRATLDSDAQRRRDDMLREASRAWRRGGKGGGEVALYYAERAREFQELARKEALECARGSVLAKRSTSADKGAVDLHGTTAAEAVDIVREILRSEGCSAAKPLRVITGRGSHSVNRVGVLKPALRGALVQDGWAVSEWEAGLVVRGKR